MASELLCDACEYPMSAGLEKWHYVCRFCGLERAMLSPQINAVNFVDEQEREKALRPIRERNFDLLLSWLHEHLRNTLDNSGKKRRLLDVGCAHGWFIEKAQTYFQVLGIEPDKTVANKTLGRNLPVRIGFFPNALDDSEMFDIIVFNDVLEHIPDVRNVIKQCNARLSRNGILVVNAPDNLGIFYRLSKIFRMLGNSGAFNRMWQVGLPSPHLYYFSGKSINLIAENSGFKVIAGRSLPSVVVTGLFERINHTKGKTKLQSVILAGAILTLIPIIKLCHSDISVWLLRKNNNL